MNTKTIGDNPNKTRRRSAPVRGVLDVAVIAFVFGWAPNIGIALPVDPQRPFEVTNCAAAVDRLKEALIGSPLISPEENVEVVATARDWADQLCRPDEVQDLMRHFGAPK